VSSGKHCRLTQPILPHTLKAGSPPDIHCTDCHFPFIHFMSGSPCINAGTNAARALPETDKDGNSRIINIDDFAQPVNKIIPVGIIVKDRFAFNPTADDVM
jgi:hypothetical protein